MKKIFFSLLFAAIAITGYALQGSPDGLLYAMAVPAADASAIKNYAGSYDKSLIQQFLNGLDFANDLSLKRNVRESLNLTKFEAQNGFRPLFTDVKSSKRPGRKYTGRVLDVKGGMKIFEVVPEELRGTWMGEMLDPNAKDVPFAQWVWQREFEKLASEINDNFYLSEYHADAEDFDPGATYAAADNEFVRFGDSIYKCISDTTAGQSPATHPAKWEDADSYVVFDGPGTIIAKEITAGKITPIVTGAIDDTNAVAKLKQVWRAAPVAHRKKGMVQYVSFNTFESYITDHNTRYGTGNSVSGNDVEEALDGRGVYLKESNRKCLIMPVTWMNDSGRVIMTFKENMVVGTNQLSDMNKIGKMVDTIHGFDAICKFLIGFNVADLECLYVNDQA